MPILEYICPNCKFLFEEIVPKVTDLNRTSKCKKCGTVAEKIASIPGRLVVKGSSYIPGDQQIGKDAEARWKAYEDRKSEREKAGFTPERPERTVIYKDEDKGVSSFPVSNTEIKIPTK